MQFQLKVEMISKIEVLKLGADDFLLKPFNLEELQLKVDRNIKKYKKVNNKKQETQIKFNNLLLNIETREVFVDWKKCLFNHSKRI